VRASLLALLLLTAASRGSLDGLAESLVERARPALDHPQKLDVAVVVAAPSARLSTDLAGLLAAKLRALGARAVVGQSGGGFERIVRVQVASEGNKLRASGEVLAVESATWAPEPQLVSHLFAEAPLDAELRAYLPSAAHEAWQARGFPVGDVPLLALAAGDLDGDGRAEVIGATAQEAIGWSFDGEKFVEKVRIRLDGAPAPIRPRSDVAVVTVAPNEIIARSSRFAAGVHWTPRGTNFVRGWPNGCELEAGYDWFVCKSPEHIWNSAVLPGAHPARAFVGPPGIASLTLTPGAQPSTVAGVGAQIALAPLERGDVVVTSEPSERGEPDAIVVRQLAAGMSPVHRVDRLPGSVRALAAGDVDGDGKSEIIAAVRDDDKGRTELWLVR
jgi:hypothetical protein